MNAWPFIIAAYGLTGVATAAVAAWSYVAMRRAERAADELTRR
ncbi:hypothetical protein [Sphingomonas sp. Leaf33]|nr:hypothetical protein [Sphingomonas sp. Leaf33]